ncbi:MAG: alpha/beta hydrolase [Actinomycetota bacterium]
MPELDRPDGARIHWQARGEGPTVVLAVHVAAHPAVFGDLVDELAGDHRVVAYDRRGTGRSSHDGPYDLETDSADLAAVIAAAGAPAVVIGWGDGAMTAVRLSAKHADLITALVALGGNPLGLAMASEIDAPAASHAVLEALEQGMRTDYRSTIRGMVRANSLQMSEEEMRRRVEEQVAYCPRDVALARLGIWIKADARPDATRMRDRISVLLFETALGPPPDIARAIRRQLPEAHVEVLDDGPISRPDLTTEAVRRFTAPLRTGTGTPR